MRSQYSRSLTKNHSAKKLKPQMSLKRRKRRETMKAIVSDPPVSEAKDLHVDEEEVKMANIGDAAEANSEKAAVSTVAEVEEAVDVVASATRMAKTKMGFRSRWNASKLVVDVATGVTEGEAEAEARIEVAKTDRKEPKIMRPLPTQRRRKLSNWLMSWSPSSKNEAA